MKQLFSSVLIVGFLFVDFLFFHDMFKPGETTSLAQYLTGLLSIPVLAIALLSLIPKNKQAKTVQ